MGSLDRGVHLGLQADGRESNLALARALDLSPSAMLGRVSRLERSIGHTETGAGDIFTGNSKAFGQGG